MSFFSKKDPEANSAAPKAPLKERLHTASKSHSSRRGAFSAGLTALAVAAVVIFNLLVAQLPVTATQFDMTDAGIYQITDTSTAYLAGITDDVEIHVLSGEDSVDSRIVRFLAKYASLSDHVSVEYVDPVVHPAVLSKYNVESNTVVVTCGATDRQESFDLSDVIGYDQLTYYYYGQYTETDFDAEGLLTSAIDGVLSDASRVVYRTAGHDETTPSVDTIELLSKNHLSLSEVNLLTNNGIPDDCDLLLILAPTRDLADDELTMLREYLSTGGQVIYCMADQTLSLPNFEALCTDYGMTVAPGLIADTQRYYQNNPFLFFPKVDSSVDAANNLTNDSTVLFYGARGVTLTDPVRDTVTVKSFLDTSEGGYAVTEDNTQTLGVYSVGAVATEEIDDNIIARLTVYGAVPVDTAVTTAFTNLDNTSLFLQSILCGFGDLSNLSIQPVSLQDPTNTVTTGGLWAILFILVIPLAAIIYGFVRWMRRRKL
jgi:ABC-2 type transport system permease protein